MELYLRFYALPRAQSCLLFRRIHTNPYGLQDMYWRFWNVIRECDMFANAFAATAILAPRNFRIHTKVVIRNMQKLGQGLWIWNIQSISTIMHLWHNLQKCFLTCIHWPLHHKSLNIHYHGQNRFLHFALFFSYLFPYVVFLSWFFNKAWGWNTNNALNEMDMNWTLYFVVVAARV